MDDQTKRIFEAITEVLEDSAKTVHTAEHEAHDAVFRLRKAYEERVHELQYLVTVLQERIERDNGQGDVK